MQMLQPEGAGQATLATGEVLEILLEDMPGAGYLWALDVEGPLTVDEPDFDAGDRGADAPIGGATTRTWRVVARAPGRARVSGRRGQAWDPSQSDKSFVLDVDISG